LARVPEHEALEFEFCAICERALLVGERSWSYVAAPGDARTVCTLCKSRAEASGWVPAALAEAQPWPRQRTRGSRFGAGLAGAAARVRRGLAPPAPAPPPEEDLPAELAAPTGVVEQAPEPYEPTEPEPVPIEPEDTPAPVAEPDLPFESLAADQVVARALRVFNSSEEQRQVGGLRRTLGNPLVSVQPAGDGRDVAVLVIAWDLSWYEWEVDVNDGEAGVTEVRKGSELSELGDPTPEWNAGLGDDDQVTLAPA
jgi:hypothetical protein